MNKQRCLRLILGLGIGLAAMAPPPILATPVDREILDRVGPRVINRGQSKKDLVEIGRKLFFEETFDGNGRTCGTCHPATNNFTIDPAYIARLPKRDPLFVAEHNPKLRQLENSKLLRRFGLILENLDGFERPGLMRGVPHNLALRTNTTSNLPGRAHALGWSGDGSPGEGSVRFFTLGAVVQHFPKSMNREEGVDFRIPTDRELDALEAFMFSVGRQQEINLATMTFADEVVEEGKHRFNGEGVNRACSACHLNAGSNRADGVNANFDTGTRLVSTGTPPDGGFGAAHEDRIDGYGDGTMNTPSLIEAADTAPFFHNNSAKTLEEAVRFYTTATFGGSGAGQFGGAFDLDDDGINAIGALLRTLNAMENIRFGNSIAEAARRTVPKSAADQRIREAMAEIGDAIEVLTGGPLKLYPAAVTKLRAAAKLERQALGTKSRSKRNALLGRANRAKQDASALMID